MFLASGPPKRLRNGTSFRIVIAIIGATAEVTTVVAFIGTTKGTKMADTGTTPSRERCA